MNFSDLFKHSGKLVSYSPNGFFIASVSQYRLLIQDVKSLQMVNMYNCLDTIQEMKWSPDSLFILCSLLKRGIVQVWSLEHPEWTCKIDEGSAGLIAATWSPNSRHILTTSEFHLRITLWSLSDKSVSYMKYPKACHQNLSFSPGGKYLALAERRNLKDFISILDCSNWQLVKHFSVDTEDLDGVQWSPDARVLAAWESNLRYRICLYSVEGKHLHSFSAYNIEQGILGIKTVSWSPTGQLLAIGSYDQKCRVLNHINWRCLAELGYPLERSVDPSLEPNLIIYQEELFSDDISSFPVEQSRYIVVDSAVKVSHVRPDSTKPHPKIGVGLALFSPDNRFLVTRNDNQAHALWIWNTPRLCLSTLLIHRAPVKAAAWDPAHSGRLALVTGGDRVYMWSPDGCLSVQVPNQSGFSINQISWQPNGQSILLLSETEYSICFLDNDYRGEPDETQAMEPNPKSIPENDNDLDDESVQS